MYTTRLTRYHLVLPPPLSLDCSRQTRPEAPAVDLYNPSYRDYNVECLPVVTGTKDVLRYL